MSSVHIQFQMHFMNLTNVILHCIDVNKFVFVIFCGFFPAHNFNLILFVNYCKIIRY